MKNVAIGIVLIVALSLIFIFTKDNKNKMYTYTSDANGFDTNNFFYDNGEEVVVFDTQFTSEIATKAIEYIKSKTQNPITYVVITHPNPDKFNAISTYTKEGAKIIASSATVSAMQGVHAYKKYYFVNIAKMFTDENYPAMNGVDIVFDKSYDLELKNGEKISLKELGNPGVSSNQTVAYIPNAKALIVGDLVHYKAHAWLEGGIVNGKPTPTIEGWIKDLEEIDSTYTDRDTIVYGGRGESVKIQEAVSEEIKYLNKANSIVDEYINSLGANSKAELTGAKAQDHYNNIQAKFVEAFPDYKLPYMIGYSVYGLVNSKLGV